MLYKPEHLPGDPKMPLPARMWIIQPFTCNSIPQKNTQERLRNYPAYVVCQ